ncbi:MAG TPA: UbiA family prenyltransferase [Ohtaekwangia sp.]
MFTRSAWLHLRIPFSYYLLPVFLFSLAVSPNFGEKSILWTFIIVHLFLYPASNGYNSYFDKDEKSIGGLKNPPRVTKGLYYLSILFDLIAIVLAAIMLTITFSIMVFIYGLISKAYSHPAIRLKKYPIIGWLTVSIFQGLFTFLMCYAGINGYTVESLIRTPVIIPGLLSSILLLGTYPMTQVYQHEEDQKRGDKTFSMMMGIRGTFYFVGGLFGFATLGFVFYFIKFFDIQYAYIFVLSLLPVVIFFMTWFLKVYRNDSNADHRNTMRLNFISATCLNAFFIYLFLNSSQVLQVF